MMVYSGRTITLICEHCKKEYEIDYYLRNKSRFCGNSCSATVRILDRAKSPSVVILICEYCGHNYNATYHDRNIRRFCGSSCAQRFNAPSIAESLAAKDTQTLEPGTQDYVSIHKWVRKNKIKKYRCTVCHKQRGTHWAYLGANPDNTDSYVEMCVPCHTRFDRRRVGVIL